MEKQLRTEKDHLGEAEIPVRALYGIHAWRAQQNFPANEAFSKAWFQAMGTVKLACYKTYEKFVRAATSTFKDAAPLSFIPLKSIEALQKAATQVSEGDYFDQFIVPAIQGGAGTSINMNINEIIANVALIDLQLQPGNYQTIDPVEEANIYQSTNDTVPAALKVASIRLLLELEEAINLLRHDIEKLEQANRNNLRIAFTQMQQAVPSSVGRLFSTYNEALSRDWWRISRAQERLKVVNLGGSAIGSGITVPRYFIMQVVQTLQQITGLPLTRSENMHDATCNLDPFVEVHGFLKAHAVNLEKMVSDLRLLSSDLLENNDLKIPQKQVGSSIMPGKVNPVIPEFVISAVHKIYANDQLITQLCAQGALDLNAYLPSIGHAFLQSIELLISANSTIKNNLISGLKVIVKNAEDKLYHSASVCTALLPFIGYHKSEALSACMQNEHCSVFDANKKLNLMEETKLQEILSAPNLLQEGFSLHDLI